MNAGGNMDEQDPPPRPSSDNPFIKVLKGCLIAVGVLVGLILLAIFALFLVCYFDGFKLDFK